MNVLEGQEYGVSDLLLIEQVTEEMANDNLKLRFEKGKVCKSNNSLARYLLGIIFCQPAE